VVVKIRPCAIGRPSCDVGDEHQHAGQALSALDDAELGRLLDRVDGVAAGIGQADDLGLGGLGLQQEGREVGGRERRAHAAQHLAAGGLDAAVVSRSSAWPKA
jgi:hypothetical protein